MEKNSLFALKSREVNFNCDGLKRVSTAEESEYLQYLLKQSLSPRKRLLKTILNTFVMWGLSLLGFLLFSGMVRYMATYSEWLHHALAFPSLQTLVFITIAFYGLFSSYRWLTINENTYPLILQDINEQQVIDEIYPIQEACRFQEPEMGGFIYFLKVSEQKIFVVYDFKSQANPDNVFLIQQKLIISRAAHCGHYVSQRFEGDPVAVSRTHLLTLDPDKWPSSGTWLILPWLALVPTFSNIKLPCINR